MTELHIGTDVKCPECRKGTIAITIEDQEGVYGIVGCSHCDLSGTSHLVEKN